jgi:TonB-dependent SusC/RagA subfamily outer membrane receptor
MYVTARPLSGPSAALARVTRASGRVLRCAALLTAIAAAWAPALAAQGAASTAPAKPTVTLTGTIKDLATGLPVEMVTVRVPGMGQQVVTDNTGSYRIPNLQMGAVVAVEAERVGYGVRREENIRLDQAIVTKNIDVNSNALSLQAVTTVGVGDGKSAYKQPFAVSRIDADQMLVPDFRNALASLVGHVPGFSSARASGMPGDSMVALLRSSVSPFKNNSPLLVVDGVPLAQMPNVMADILGLDVESVQIIRGAAAAAAYGARAAGGAILITSKRARNVPVNGSELEFRQYVGTGLLGSLPDSRKYHAYQLDSNGDWFDPVGDTAVAKYARVLMPIPFQINSYRESHDPLRQALFGKRTLNTRISITQASPVTNLSVAFNRNVDPGLVKFNTGLTQNSVRFFLGQQLRDNIAFDASFLHSRGSRREPQTPFRTLFTIEPDVNLLAPNTADRERLPTFPYAIQPDTGSIALNPVFTEWRAANFETRQRSLLSGSLQVRPYKWIALRTQVGYDRANFGYDRFTPPGVPSGPFSVTTGSINYSAGNADMVNGELVANLAKQFGGLATTLTLRGHEERQLSLQFTTAGTSLTSGQVSLGAASQVAVTSEEFNNRLSTQSAELGLDLHGRYIGNVVVLREGNAWFGDNNRWNQYFRAGGAWLLSEESWYPASLKNFTLAKFRATLGSAGTLPDFLDQYDFITVTDELGFIRSNLGNVDIAPERKTEIELGMDMIYKNKISFSLTYAGAKVKEAILPAVAPANTGFATIQRNIGSSEGSTIEGAIEANWINTQVRNQPFRWRSDITASHSSAKLVAPGEPCIGIGTYHPVCDGVSMSALYGFKAMRSHDDLIANAPSFETYRDWWQVNDDGYLVPVGLGNSYTEGVSKNLWGTNVHFDVGSPAGVTKMDLAWGLPQWGPMVDTVDGRTDRRWQKIGDTQPTLEWGLGNRVSWGNWIGYAHLRGAMGGDVWDGFTHDMTAANMSTMVDQVGKSEDHMKPTYYYSGGAPNQADPIQGVAVGLAGANSVAYDVDVVHGVNWLKLGEVMLGYTIDSRNLAVLKRFGAQRVNLQFSGRDLYTFKGNYKGLDPEVYVRRGNAFLRFDDFRYPPMRNLSGSIAIIF